MTGDRFDKLCRENMEDMNSRIIRLKERILEYSFKNANDTRAGLIWKDCTYDIAKERVVDIYNYELRMDALEIDSRDK